MVRTGKDFYLTIGLLLDAKIENFVMVRRADNEKNNRILLIRCIH